MEGINRREKTKEEMIGGKYDQYISHACMQIEQ
jgi:hypothetical protein